MSSLSGRVGALGKYFSKNVVSPRRSPDAKSDQHSATPQSLNATPLTFETLEPRLLLAADPLGITAGYAFDESSGTTTADASGHGITGTLTNGPTFTPGHTGNAITLDGVNDYVSLGNPAALQLTGSMTASAWVYATAFPVDDAAVVSKRASNEIGFQLDLTVDTGPRTIGFKLTNSSGGQMFRYGATALQLNTWYYVTGVYDAANQTLNVYLNGQLDNGALQGTITPSQQNSTANVEIGGRPNSTSFQFKGLIDDVRIADHALTQDQIQTNMTTSLSAPDNIAPTVSLTAPPANNTVAGTVTLTATASDNIGVAGVQFLLDGNALGAEDTTSPYSLAWNSASGSVANGPHTLAARARDTSGNTATTTPINIVVDNQAPTGSIIINGGAAATNSTTATLTLSATDALSSVTQMRFSNNGTSYSTAQAFAASATWTLTTGAGTKTVYAQFMDAAGNWSTAVTDTIVLDTTAPTISARTATNITGTSATITWTTNEAATSQVEYGLTTSYGSITTIDQTLVTAHSIAITGLTPNTTYNWRVRSKDAAGNEAISANSTLTTAAAPDTTNPTVALTAPAVNAIIAGTVTLTATASDNVAVAGVQFLLDGNPLGAEDTTSPYSLSWNTASGALATTSGPHTLAARARDTSGNTATTTAINIVVDNVAPVGTVAINSNAAATNNATVTLALSASDTQGAVTQMRFSNDGTTYSAAEAYATSKTWTLSAGDGTKTVYAQFQDAAGNWSTAVTDTIVLDTTAPTISARTATNITGTSATITWTTNEAATSQVEYGLTTSYGSITTIDQTLVTAHSIAITGLTPNTTYNWRVRSKDAAGNEAISANSTLTTAAAPDTTNPTVALTAPAVNAIIAGTVTLTATASDNVAVAGVQFLLDGNPLGAEDTTSPYSLSWNTASGALATTSGPHTLAARARDTSGNTATTTAINIVVDNVAPVGTVAINSNAAATNNATVTLALSASDTQGAVTQMRFSNDGTTYSAAEAYATSKTWTLSAGDGTKTVYAQFQDAAGNWSTAVTDTIVLDTTAPTISAVVATVVTSSSVTITWTTNEPATSQVDYGLTTSYGSSSPLDTTLVAAHSVTLTGLAANSTYDFRVRSNDTLGNGVPSGNATFIIDTTAPSIPTGLTATAISSSQINLLWTASTDNVAVTGYQVFRGSNQIATVATASYSDTGLTAGTNYAYTVKAVDAVGNASAASGSANATTLASDTTAPTVAITTTPTPTTVSGTSAALQSLETSFQQDLNGDGLIGPANVSSPHFVYQGLDSSGAQLYSVTWNTLGSHPFAVRVLAPTHPSTNYQHNFLFALPVEAGLAQSTYGSGLDELQKLDVEDQYNATIIEPIFPIDSWYADNPTDATIDFETFTAMLLPTWVSSNFATSGTEKDLLIGFSKSGYGGLDLLFKHSSVFDGVAAFDFPADAAAYDDFGSSSSGDYGTDANFQTNYRMTGTFIDTFKAPFTTEDRILISEGPVFQTQVADFDALLTSHGVVHTLLTTQTSDAHTWSSGWLTDAVAGLYGLETTVPQTVIEDFGSTSLVKGGSNYFLYPNGGSAVELSYAGAPVAAGQFDQSGGPWAPIGVEQTASGYEVAWKVTGADKYTVWNTDNNGNYVSSAFSVASGTVGVAANASDDVGVVGVQFLLDGNLLGTEDTTSPYSVSWDTTSATNGPHTLTARARDAAGNMATSTSVTVNVSNQQVSAPLALVQTTAVTPQSPQTQATLTFASAQVAGDTNIIVIGWSDATSNIVSITDSAGNVYQLAAPTTRGAAVSQAIYYASNIKAAAAGSNTLTVTFNTSAPYIDLRAAEYSGLAANPVDVTASATGTSATASTAAVTTTQDHELVFAAGTTWGTFLAAGTNFTNRLITIPDGDIVEDRFVTSKGSYSATASLAGSAAWVVQVVTFKASS
jgi:hypothetical protein